MIRKSLQIKSLILLLSFPAGLAAAPDARVRGWVSEAGPAAGELPGTARVLEDQDGLRFIELPASAVAGLAGRGLRFQEAPEAFMLSAGGRRFDVRDGEPDLPPAWRAPESTTGLRPYLVKFHAPVSPAWLARLEAAGGRPLQYVPSFGYLLLVPRGFAQAARKLDAVEFAGEYHPAYKCDPSLQALAGTDEHLRLSLVLFDLPGTEEAIRQAATMGNGVRSRSEAAATSQRALLHYVVIEDFPAARLPELLARPEVYRADPWTEPRLEGERAAQITAGNVSLKQPLPDYFSWLAEIGADGSGVTVAIADTGLDTGDDATVHVDVRGRTTYATAICADSADYAGHGSNVAGIVGADGRATSGGTGLTDSLGFHWGGGSAPGATLYIQSALGGACPAVADAASLASNAVGSGGAQLSNQSFTTGEANGNGYTAQAQAWDAVVRDALPGTPGSQPYAVVFSAGNSGPGGSTLTAPHAAKNIVTVGATENYRPGECPNEPGCGGEASDIDEVVSFSSRGPTADGRIKPDVVAPGHVISGLFSNATQNYGCHCDNASNGGCCDSQNVDGTSSYTRYSGTSQASPRVAGASAVVYDWFQDRTGVFPSPAMNKAILINSARDMKTADAPNNNEGWGRVALRDVLQAPADLLDQSVVLGTVGDGAANVRSLFVQDPAAPLKATLVWTDPPGSVNCNPCLVNNLDLEILSGGTTWRGNNFSAGFTTPGGTNDVLNNVEGIRLPGGTLSCSAFDIKVRAQTLGGDGVPGNGDATDQDFALVVRNAGATPGPPKIVVAAAGAAGGCDGDEFLDRGETVDMTVVLENAGCTGGTGLSASLSLLSAPPGTSIDVTPAGPRALPDLAVDGLTPMAWQISLADGPDSFCGEVAKLQLDVHDGGDGAWQEVIEIVLDGDSLAQNVVLDQANTDQSSSKSAEWNIDNCRVSSPTTSWHMGQSDCSGVVRDAAGHSVTFTYNLSSGDRLQTLTFKHAFDAYSNGTYFDTANVEIDHDNDGVFDTLQTWTDGIDNPLAMTAAGPYDLSPYNATRASSVSVRFRFQSATSWVGPNQVSGWDVDDISFAFDNLVCDPATCTGCAGAPAPVPGDGLTVEPDPAGLRLTWSAVAGATSYDLYEGSLGTFYSHDRFTDPGLDGPDSCQEPGTTVAIGLPAGDVYFFVASDSGCAESAAGFDSTGSPVPPAVTPCTP